MAVSVDECDRSSKRVCLSLENLIDPMSPYIVRTPKPKPPGTEDDEEPVASGEERLVHRVANHDDPVGLRRVAGIPRPAQRDWHQMIAIRRVIGDRARFGASSREVGSSPRTRARPGVGVGRTRIHGSIPAYAGETTLCARRRRRSTARTSSSKV